MRKPRLAYFEQEDVLHLAISDEAEASSVELSPNVTAELNAKGELIGIEILNASDYVRDSDYGASPRPCPFDSARAFARRAAGEGC